MKTPETLTDTDFENKVKEANISIVDFWAPWCGPCKIQGPVLEELAGEVNENIMVGKVNTDENQNIARKFEIMSIPTILYFKNGNLEKTSIGLQSKQQMLDSIKELA